MTITVATFKDVAGGTQPGQFTIGENSYHWLSITTVVKREVSEHSPGEPMIHDFENAGDSEIRFVTVELLD